MTAVDVWIQRDGSDWRYEAESLSETRDPDCPPCFGYVVEGVYGDPGSGEGPFVIHCWEGRKLARTISGYAMAYAMDKAGFLTIIPRRD